MQLDIRGAAAVLNVPESTIHRWIQQKHFPFRGVEGRYRFARTEVLEWATQNHVALSVDIFQGDAHPSLFDALESGGISYGVAGTDKRAVLRAVVDSLSLPEGTDPALVLQLFLAREDAGSTAVGDGIAIPHPRHPLVLPVAKPMLSLCFLAEPIDFCAKDGKPVHTLFVLFSPTVPIHLQMLARIARLLSDERFHQTLVARKPRQEILAETRRVEKSFEVPAVAASAS